MILINTDVECADWAHQSFEKFISDSEYEDRPKKYLGKEGACYVFAVAMDNVDEDHGSIDRDRVLIEERDYDGDKIAGDTTFMFSDKRAARRGVRYVSSDELFQTENLLIDDRPLPGIAIFKIFKQGFYAKERLRNFASNFGFGPRKIYGTCNYMVISNSLESSFTSRSTLNYLLNSECHIALDQIDRNHVWFGWDFCKSRTYISPSVSDFAVTNISGLASKVKQLKRIESGDRLRKSIHQRLLCDCITTPQWGCVVGCSEFQELSAHSQDYVISHVARLDILTLVNNDQLKSYRGREEFQNTYFRIRERDPETGIFINHVRVGIFQDTDDCPVIKLRHNCLPPERSITL